MPAEPAPTRSGSSRCANCGAPLTGRFCAACGQEDRDPARTPLRELLVDWLGAVLSFDSRLLRTLWPLATRPGFLTLEYLAGRRRAYVPPLRLFLFTSVVAFLLLGLSGATLIRKSVTADGAEAGLSAAAAQEDGRPGAAGAPSEGERTVWQRFAAAEPEELNDIFLRRVPQALFLLAPLLGALLWWVYRGVERYYVPHLILSLHFHTFTFISLTAATLADLAFEGQPAAGVATLVLAVYFFLAQRRIYGRGRLATAVTTVGMGVVYAVGWVVTTFGLLLLTLALG